VALVDFVEISMSQ